MSKLMSKAAVGVIYSQRTWNLYKTGVWFLTTLAVWLAFFVLAVTTSILFPLKGVQFNYALTEAMFNILLFSSFIVSGTIAYYRSLNFNPQEKVKRALESK